MRRSFPWIDILLACVLALVIRFAYLVGTGRSPLFLHPDPISFQAPYAWFLALISRVAGSNPLVPRLLQCLLDLSSIVLLGAVAHAISGRRAAALTADLGAIYGPLIYFQAELAPTTLHFFLVVASLYLTVRAARSGTRVWIFIGSLSLALALILAIHSEAAGVGPGKSFGERLLLVWNRREAACGTDQRFFAPYHSFLFRVPLLLSFAWVGPVALVAAWNERRRAPLLVAFLVLVTVALAAGSVCDRTRLPLLAAALPLAGAAIDRSITALSMVGADVGEGRMRVGAALRSLVRAHGRTLIALGIAALVVVVPFPRLQRPDFGGGWLALAGAYQRAGDTRTALEAYSRAELNGMKSADFYARWGALEWSAGVALSAEQHLLTAIGLMPGQALAHETLGHIYFVSRRYAQAAQEYEVAARISRAREAELLTRAGESYEELGNRGRAAVMFERALAARPGYGAAETGLERIRHPGAARESVRMWGGARPSPPSAR